MSLLKDIKTAAYLFSEVRKARKKGASGVLTKSFYSVPVLDFSPAYANTIEWGLSWRAGREADRAVMEVFKRTQYEKQRWLECSPKTSRDWVERARFWQRELEAVLPPAMYHKAMALFISWYIRCLRKRKGQAEQ